MFNRVCMAIGKAIGKWFRAVWHFRQEKFAHLSEAHTPYPYRLSGGTEQMGDLGALEDYPDSPHHPRGEVPQRFLRS